MPVAPVPTELALLTRGFGTEAVTPPETGSGLPFGDILKDAIASANVSATEADKATHAFAAGASDDIHGTMIASKEAEIELKLVANVRSKLVDAFNDLWRMSI